MDPALRAAPGRVRAATRDSWPDRAADFVADAVRPVAELAAQIVSMASPER